MTEVADVIVVGAGFAGLVAARDLGQRGFDMANSPKRVDQSSWVEPGSTPAGSPAPSNLDV